jgi:hypothetical protein
MNLNVDNKSRSRPLGARESERHDRSADRARLVRVTLNGHQEQIAIGKIALT